LTIGLPHLRRAGLDGLAGKQFALVLTHDVDTGKGQERCLDLARLEIGVGISFILSVRSGTVSGFRSCPGISGPEWV
jgi:hypothetical protein